MKRVFLVDVIFFEVCAYFRSFLNCFSMDSFSVLNFLFKYHVEFKIVSKNFSNNFELLLLKQPWSLKDRD